MATYNGEKFLNTQVHSILSQLAPDDELIISDDHSNDSTIDILRNFDDSRIKIIYNTGGKGAVSNFQNALLHCKGEIIFLSDQDDIWMNDRMKEAIDMHKKGYDLVACNCILIDENDKRISPDPYFNSKHPLKRNFFMNLYENSFYGCCMSFNRKALMFSLPFPEKIIMHDVWIGMLAKAKFNCGYIEKCLVLYRRHFGTTSFGKRKGGKIVRISNFYRIKTRLILLYYIFKRLILTG
jgi:glycosyltransferase involved in cell wall biosynthesis